MGRCSHASHPRLAGAVLLLTLGACFLLLPFSTRADSEEQPAPSEQPTDAPILPPAEEPAQLSTPSGVPESITTHPISLSDNPPFVDYSNPINLPALFLSILDPKLSYPELDYGYIPNTFSRPAQDAFKDGDETALGIVIHYAVPVVRVTADLSALGGDSETVLSNVFTVSSYAAQYQSDPIIVNTGGANASTTISISTTDVAGVTVTKSIPVRVDNTSPIATLTAAITDPNPKDGDTILLSGTLRDGGHSVHSFNTLVSLLDANGTVYGTHDYKSELSDLGYYLAPDGTFTNVPFEVYETWPFFFADAKAFQIEIIAKDGAGATSSARFILPLHASTTPEGVPASNVLFLPGIEATRLYDMDYCLPIVVVCDNNIWEFLGDDGIKQMYLNAAGKSIRNDVHVREGDIITNEVGIGDIYDSFFAVIDHLKETRVINDWRAVPYDWRLSLSDIVNNGVERHGRIFYTEQATTTPYIESQLKLLASESRTGKVTIIAHSNGGLVAKALMRKLGDAETARLIDKVIFVGVPQSGAPLSIGTLLFGYGQAQPFDSCADSPFIGGFCSLWMSRQVSRTFAQNSPGAYQLLPSARYFADVSDSSHPLISFTGEHLQEAEHRVYGSAVRNIHDLYSYLTANDGGRTMPGANDIGSPNVANPSLITYARETHNALDAWTPPAGVSVYQIAGWGNNTFAGVQFYEEPHLFGLIPGYKLQYRPIFTETGDGTVPVPSALMIGGENRYWINLRQASGVADKVFNHANFFSLPNLQTFIQNTLIASTGSLPAYITESQPVSTSTEQLLFVLHSPLTLELKDDSGHRVGQTLDGTNYQEIPEATFGQFGEVKYVLVPHGDYTVTMHGQDTGSFSLDVQQLQGGTVVTTTTFADVPATSSTIATLTVSTTASTSPLSVDEDGDGSEDITLSPVENETVVYAPPVPAISEPEPTIASSTEATSNESHETTEGDAFTFSYGGTGKRTVYSLLPTFAIIPTILPAPLKVVTQKLVLVMTPIITKKKSVAIATSSRRESFPLSQTLPESDLSQTAGVYNAISVSWLTHFFSHLSSWVSSVFAFIRAKI